MTEIRIKDLPEDINASPANDFLPVDGASTRRVQLSRFADVVRPYASQAEAEAGIATGKTSTPQRVAQQIDARIATQAEAEAGVDLVKLMTPARTAAAIAAIGGFIIADAADVRARTVPAPVVRFMIAEYTTGDIGGCWVERVGAEPSHAGKIQDASGAWFEISEDVLNPRMLGAAGDGVTNDRIALFNMFAIPGVQDFDGLGKTYAINQTILVERGGLHVRRLFTTGVIADTTPSIKFQGSLGTAVSLSSTTSARSNTAAVADASTFSVDQWIWLRSTDVLFGSTNTFGELAKIRQISGTTLTLYDPVRLPYDTGSSATAAPVSMLENIVLEDCGVYGDVSVTNQIGFEFLYCADVEIRNPRTEDCEYVHIWVKTCADVRIFGGQGERTGVIQGLNYGVVAGDSTNGLLLQGYTGRSMRHVLATGGSQGINRNIRAYHNNCLDCIDAGLDAHGGTAEHDYSHNIVVIRDGLGATAADGIISQGLDFTCVGNQIYNPTRHGIFFQPLVSAASMPARATITGNTLYNPQNTVSGNTNGILAIAGVQNIEALTIHGNSGEEYDTFINLSATVGDILYFSIQGNTGRSLVTRGIYAVGSANRLIRRGIIVGNVMHMNGGAAEVCYLVADSTGRVREVAIGNNVFNGGTYGLRLNYTTDVRTDGGNLFLNGSSGTHLTANSTNTTITEP